MKSQNRLSEKHSRLACRNVRVVDPPIQPAHQHLDAPITRTAEFHHLLMERSDEILAFLHRHQACRHLVRGGHIDDACRADPGTGWRHPREFLYGAIRVPSLGPRHTRLFRGPCRHATVVAGIPAQLQCQSTTQASRKQCGKEIHRHSLDRIPRTGPRVELRPLHAGRHLSG